MASCCCVQNVHWTVRRARWPTTVRLWLRAPLAMISTGSSHRLPTVSLSPAPATVCFLLAFCVFCGSIRLFVFIISDKCFVSVSVFKTYANCVVKFCHTDNNLGSSKVGFFENYEKKRHENRLQIEWFCHQTVTRLNVFRWLLTQ